MSRLVFSSPFSHPCLVTFNLNLNKFILPPSIPVLFSQKIRSPGTIQRSPNGFQHPSTEKVLSLSIILPPRIHFVPRPSPFPSSTLPALSFSNTHTHTENVLANHRPDRKPLNWTIVPICQRNRFLYPPHWIQSLTTTMMSLRSCFQITMI